MPPEAIQYGSFSEESDVWAWGITCWEIFKRGAIPYPTIQPVDIVEFLKTGRRLEKPEYCNMEMYQLLMSTWNWEYTKRPKFKAVRDYMMEKHPVTATIIREQKASITSVISQGVYGNPSTVRKTNQQHSTPSFSNTRPSMSYPSTARIGVPARQQLSSATSVKSNPNQQKLVYEDYRVSQNSDNRALTHQNSSQKQVSHAS